VLASHPARVSAKVVAVVLNWNGWQDTVECLEGLLASREVPAQIVVCDNGSIDGSLTRLREWAACNAVAFEEFVPGLTQATPFAPLVFINNGENRGFAAGNNAGIHFAVERARADYVWVLNNDAVPDPRALERMLETARGDASIGMVGSALVRHDDPETIQALGGGYILPVICHDTQLAAGKPICDVPAGAIELEHLIGASMLVRAAAIRDVGLMDETYFLYREETDWCIAMRRRGWNLYCRTDATVRHKQARSIGFKSPLHDYYAVRNMLRLVKKFYPAQLPTAMAYYACRSLLPKLARMQFARIGAVLRALRDFLAGTEGRGAHHTDAAMLRQYVTAGKPATGTYRNWTAAVKVALYAAVLAAIGIHVATVASAPPPKSTTAAHAVVRDDGVAYRAAATHARIAATDGN
jgi:GT2 family glycosyltransferase